VTAARVSVVMVAYGNADRIGPRVRSLVEDPLVREVIVIDHGTDGSGDLAAAAGATVHRDPSNPGFGAGMNSAVARSSAPFIVLMNPDADLAIGAVAAGLAALDDDSTVAATQGLITAEATGDLERSGGDELGPVDLLGRAVGAKRLLSIPAMAALVARLGIVAHHVNRGTEEPRFVDGLASTATLYRRTAFEQIGGYDERYFLYGEDLDLCRRVRAAGWNLLYLPMPWATHEGGASASNWWNRELRWWEGTMQFAAQWWTPQAFRRGQVAAVIMALRMAAVRPRQAATAWQALVVRPGSLRKRVRQG